MKKMLIQGGNELSGTINISGAKNSVVAIIPAAILDDKTEICNVPNISDTNSLLEILRDLNVKTEFKDNILFIDSTNITNNVILEEHSKKLRASYYFMSALLARFGKVEIYLPGGCNIGERPIDLHLKGFEKMGATVENEGNKFIVTAKEGKLHGADIYFEKPSVGATVNLMIAATLADGETTITNAAKEPEIENIAEFLNSMGANITGQGTEVIKIQGVEKLHGTKFEVLPDRIEAGTYLIAGVLLGKNLKINKIVPKHLDALTSKLIEMGADLQINEDNIVINKVDNLNPINIKTLEYPGFPTDLGQPMTTILTQCNGTSYFEETIWSNRLGHVDNLNKMGANIEKKGNNSIIINYAKLKGEEVTATDLRAGAALVVGGLIADGTTTINDLDHILRGYENLPEKLNSIGAKIEIVDIK